jgi:hypothetical protein
MGFEAPSPLFATIPSAPEYLFSFISRYTVRCAERNAKGFWLCLRVASVLELSIFLYYFKNIRRNSRHRRAFSIAQLRSDRKLPPLIIRVNTAWMHCARQLSARLFLRLSSELREAPAVGQQQGYVGTRLA